MEMQNLGFSEKSFQVSIGTRLSGLFCLAFGGFLFWIRSYWSYGNVGLGFLDIFVSIVDILFLVGGLGLLLLVARVTVNTQHFVYVLWGITSRIEWVQIDRVVLKRPNNFVETLKFYNKSNPLIPVLQVNINRFKNSAGIVDIMRARLGSAFCIEGEAGRWLR